MDAADAVTTTPTPTEIPADNPSKETKPYALIVVGGGLAAAVAIFTVAIVFLHDEKDAAGAIVQVTSPAFAMIAGLVGGYFGVRAGSLAAGHVASANTPPTPAAPAPTAKTPPQAPPPPPKRTG